MRGDNGKHKTRPSKLHADFSFRKPIEHNTDWRMRKRTLRVVLPSLKSCGLFSDRCTLPSKPYIAVGSLKRVPFRHTGVQLSPSRSSIPSLRLIFWASERTYVSIVGRSYGRRRAARCAVSVAYTFA